MPRGSRGAPPPDPRGRAGRGRGRSASEVRAKQRRPRARLQEVPAHADELRELARKEERGAASCRELPDRRLRERRVRSCESQRSNRSGRPDRPAKCTRRSSGGRPSIGGCASSNSHGWNVNTAGKPASRNAASARARRLDGQDPEGPAASHGKRSAEPASRQRRHLEDRARRETRSGGARAGLLARPSGGTRVIDASQRKPSAARISSAGSLGCADGPFRGAIRRRSHSRGALHLLARSQGVVAELARASCRRRGGGGRRERRSRVRGAPPRAAGAGYRSAIQPRKKNVARWPPWPRRVEEPADGLLDPGRERVPAARVGVELVAADMEPLLRVDREHARRAPGRAQRGWVTHGILRHRAPHCRTEGGNPSRRSIALNRLEDFVVHRPPRDHPRVSERPVVRGAAVDRPGRARGGACGHGARPSGGFRSR